MNRTWKHLWSLLQSSLAWKHLPLTILAILSAVSLFSRLLLLLR